MAAVGDDNKDSRSAECDIDAGQSGNVQVPTTDGYLRLRDAAQRLGLSSKDVRQLLAAGQLTGWFGRDENGAATAYVRADDVQALLERMETLR